MSVQDDRNVIIPGGTHLEYIYPSFAYEVCVNAICQNVSMIVSFSLLYYSRCIG
jgi:hypothetical protein